MLVDSIFFLTYFKTAYCKKGSNIRVKVGIVRLGGGVFSKGLMCLSTSGNYTHVDILTGNS